MGYDTEDVSKTYFSFYRGKVVRNVTKKPDTPGAQKRTNKEGKDVYELVYPSYTGHLLDINVKEGGPYGPEWVLELKDMISGEVAVLNFPYSSGYTRSFFCQLPNADLTKAIKFKPAYEEKIVDQKSVSSSKVFLYQDGKPIGWYHKKSELNGMPDVEEYVENRVKKINSGKQMAFFVEMAKDKVAGMKLIAAENRYVIGALPNSNPSPNNPDGSDEDDPRFYTDGPGKDDLPF